ncbi:MAG: endonuclease III [Clostridiales bacterium]|jgi:endonuclease-3|nr:endonuclease III [Clostridiales bacterium]
MSGPPEERVRRVLALLDERYPWADKCYLDYGTPHQLLVATILSAQCTDARVNAVTKPLFERYGELRDFAEADLPELESYIKSAGVYHNKARNIKASAIALLERGGEMPSSVEELTALPGVGRKTANVIRSHVFGLPSVVVDTHVKRVSRRLGFARAENPDKIEFELMELLPREHWIRYNTQIIAHGRGVCKAARPRCGECALRRDCETAGKEGSDG